VSQERLFPGGPLVVEQATQHRLFPGGPFVNETVTVGGGYTHPTLSAVTATEIGPTSFKPRVTYTFPS
jgi:hypothetical protein